MKKMIFYFIIFTIFSASVEAQEGNSPMANLPGLEGVKMGEIDGLLSVTDKNGNKQPLANHKMAIVVFRDGQRVLMLDKTTDSKGLFKFKNIFQHPSFVYALGTLYEGVPYILPNLKLGEGKEKLEVDFPVGTDSPYRVEGMPPPAAEQTGKQQADMTMEPQASQMEASFSVGGPFAHPHQKAAVILSLIVVMLAIYYFAAPSKIS